MAKRRNPGHHPDVVRVLEQARRVGASSSAPRKHHLVPESYLQRWAEAGSIRVTDLARGSDYPTSPSKAARMTDYYSVASDDLDPDRMPPLLYEVLLSHVEGWGVEGINHLLSEPDKADPELLGKFTWYLGMTMSRGDSTRRRLRAMTEATFRLQYEDFGADDVRALLRREGSEPTDESVAGTLAFIEEIQRGDLVATPQNAALVGLAAQVSSDLGASLLDRTWTIFRTPRVLLTCDEPVVVIGGPGHRRDERAGVAEAGVVVFPLSPSAVLAMFRRDVADRLQVPEVDIAVGELDHVDVAALNREIAMHCQRWIFERPSKRVAAKFHISADAGSTIFEHRPDLQARGRDGEIVRIYGTTRWQGHLAHVPWPVEEWWR